VCVRARAYVDVWMSQWALEHLFGDGAMTLGAALRFVDPHMNLIFSMEPLRTVVTSEHVMLNACTLVAAAAPGSRPQHHRIHMGAGRQTKDWFVHTIDC
jgi:hypothetical protein